jgi:hypothetical protein
MTYPVFVGFSRLSDFLAELDRLVISHGRPDVYLMPIADSYPWKESSLGTVHQSIYLMTLRRTGEVAYLRLPMGRYMTNGGVACDPAESGPVLARCDSLFAQLSELVLEAGYQPVRAIVSMPRDLVTLQGEADLFELDSQTKLYRRKS